MSDLIEDIKEWYSEENYPPDGPDLDYTSETNTALVHEKDLGDLRFGTAFMNVYQRGEQFVAVRDVRPTTEMLDWGDYGEPEIYAVERVEEVVTRYVKVDQRVESAAK